MNKQTDYELVRRMIEVLLKEKSLYESYRDTLIKDIGYDRFKEVQQKAMQCIFGSKR